MLKDLRNFLNGAVYGLTLIIPGVSASILAIILGFYDELIYTINHFRKNVRYLSVFLFGVVAGAVIFSFKIIFLLENYSFPTMMFFTGLLAGIIPFVFSKTKSTYSEPAIDSEAGSPDPKGRKFPAALREIALAVFSAILLPVLSFSASAAVINPADSIGSFSIALILYIFLAGIINGATLVIPGLSGALLLLIMGLYPLIISSISSVGLYIGDITNIYLLRDISLVLLPFGIGGLIGCLGISRLMEKLLRDFCEAVYAVILGLILGSIIVLIQGQIINLSDTSIILLITGIITFCAGFAAAFFLGKRQ